MYSRQAWIEVLLLAHGVVALPKVAFPINSQVPPLARIGDPFSFCFSQSTFSSPDSGALSYVLQDAPAWLNLDGPSRTFSGTPSADDAGPQTFALVATDGDGSVQLETTFVVTSETAPQLQANVTESLAKAGQLSDETDLSLYTGSNFNLAFDSDTFGGPSNLTYTATSADNTPLPSWIAFNSQAVTFSGVTPPPVPNPQIIGLRLIGTTIAGFSAASFVFNIVISDRTLAFETLNQTIQIRPGQSVDFARLQNQLLLDRSIAPSSVIASASADAPDWLNFEPRTLRLSGVAPREVDSQDVNIKVSDIYGNNAETNIFLYTGKDMTLSSPAPKRTLSPSASASPENTSVPPSDLQASSNNVMSAKSDRDWIAAAVLLPITFLAAVAAIFICYRRRRRRTIASEPAEDMEARRHYHDEKKGRMGNQIWKSTQRPNKPQVQFKGSEKTRPAKTRHVLEDDTDDRGYAASELGSQEELVLDSHQRSSMGASAALMPGRTGFNPRNRHSETYAPYTSRENRFSRFSQRSSNITNERRLTGLGHGRFSAGSSARVQRRMSRRCNHCGSLSITTLDRLPSTTGPSKRTSRPLRSSIRHVPDDLNEGEDVDQTSESSRSEADAPQQILERIRMSDNRPHHDKRESYFRKRRASRRSALPEEETPSHDESIARLHDTIASLTRGAGRGSVRSPLSRRSTLFTSGLRISGGRTSRSNSASGSSSQPHAISWGTIPGRRSASDTVLNPFIMHSRARSRNPTDASLESEGWDDTSGETESRHLSENGMSEGGSKRDLEERAQTKTGQQSQGQGDMSPRLTTYGSLNWRMAKKPNALDSVVETQAGTNEAYENDLDDRNKAML